MYVELERESLLNSAMSADILKELLSTYFKYIDQDYRDLKKILGMDPLQVTIFTCGTFETYEKKTGKKQMCIRDRRSVKSLWKSLRKGRR